MTLCYDGRTLTEPDASTVSPPNLGPKSTSTVAGEQDNLPRQAQWQIPACVIQGRIVITTFAGAADDQRARAESEALFQLQASPQNDAFAFWAHPDEDVYEDL